MASFMVVQVLTIASSFSKVKLTFEFQKIAPSSHSNFSSFHSTKFFNQNSYLEATFPAQHNTRTIIASLLEGSTLLSLNSNIIFFLVLKSSQGFNDFLSWCSVSHYFFLVLDSSQGSNGFLSWLFSSSVLQSLSLRLNSLLNPKTSYVFPLKFLLFAFY